MESYSKEELEEALQIVSSTINRCEKIKPKFAEGTSHHNRFKKMIKAIP